MKYLIVILIIIFFLFARPPKTSEALILTPVQTNISNNIDGGNANSVYLVNQTIDGGGA